MAGGLTRLPGADPLRLDIIHGAIVNGILSSPRQGLQSVDRENPRRRRAARPCDRHHDPARAWRQGLQKIAGRAPLTRRARLSGRFEGSRFVPAHESPKGLDRRQGLRARDSFSVLTSFRWGWPSVAPKRALLIKIDCDRLRREARVRGAWKLPSQRGMN